MVETLSSDSRQGLAQNQVVSLRKAHGLNKLEEEPKVFGFIVRFNVAAHNIIIIVFINRITSLSVISNNSKTP